MTEEQSKKDKKSKQYCRSQRIFLAACLDQCQDEWVPRQVFLSCPDAVKYAYEHIQDSVRCNHPIEWWRVIEYHLGECEGEICWGPHRISPTGGCA